MTAYQKLKAENERLKQELMLICNKPNSPGTTIIKRKYQFLQNVEELLWQGDTTKINRMEYKGIIPQIK